MSTGLLWLAFLILCILLVGVGLYGMITDQATGGTSWGDMPERGGTEGWPRQHRRAHRPAPACDDDQDGAA